jgi:putative salt-induced outer membrane protein YdiY
MRPLILTIFCLALISPVMAIAQTDTPPEPETQAEPETGAETPAETDEVAEDEKAPDVVIQQQEVPWAPKEAGHDGFTWVKLISGEWMKGEIKDLRDGKMTFDSDELDEFEYDWADVLAVISSSPHTITTWEREIHTGFIVARRGNIRILDGDGELIASVHPDDVSSMIQGRPREKNYWSGLLNVGSTIRTGNSDQQDASSLIKLNRRALSTRWDNTGNVNYVQTNGESTQETHRYTSKLDLFVSRNFFVTIGDYEYFRDPFQNIAQRHIPGSGFGYDNAFGSADWDVTAGLAWQSIRYVSVAEGESISEEDWVGRLGASLEWDITSDIELDLGYSINTPFDNVDAYSSNLLSTLSLDIWWNFEFDFTFAWDRQNKPKESEDGTTPKKDDMRLTTGIGWDF